MKKRFTAVIICLFIVAMASSAMALATGADVFKTSTAQSMSSQWFGPDMISDTPGIYFTKAFLVFNGPSFIPHTYSVTDPYKSIYERSPIFNYSGEPALALSVDKLNSYIRSRQGIIDKKLVSLSCDDLIPGSRIAGSPYHPGSLHIALFGACIVALPLARRLRRSINKET